MLTDYWLQQGRDDNVCVRRNADIMSDAIGYLYIVATDCYSSHAGNSYLSFMSSA